jgi:hypothetical protein
MLSVERCRNAILQYVCQPLGFFARPPFRGLPLLPLVKRVRAGGFLYPVGA